MSRHRLLLGILALLSAFSLPAAAQSPNWTQVGSLMCTVTPSVGFIFVGHQPMQCTYTSALAPAPVTEVKTSESPEESKYVFTRPTSAAYSSSVQPLKQGARHIFISE